MSNLITKVHDKIGRKLQQIRLQNRDFTLFSNDCWGAEVYKYFNLPYNTPFIGLMLMAPCYVRLLQNPQYYLQHPLKFVTHSRYESVNELQVGRKVPFPIATLGNEVEVQFLHYSSSQEANEKWTRRVKRINWANIVVKFDGSKDYATGDLISNYQKILYPKLLLVKDDLPVLKDSIVIKEYTENGMLQFRRSLEVFDLAGWLNTGDPQLKSWMKWFHRFLY